MSTKRKKRGAQKSGTSIMIPLIIILLAIIAAIAVYFLSEKAKTVQKPQVEQIQNQKPIKTTKPENPAKAVPGTRTFLEGTWVSQSDGAMLQFHNHTFSIDIPSVDSQNYKKGTFSIKGKQITFSYTTGKTLCDKEEGIYTYRLSKGILHLKVNKDNCKSRRGTLVADWEHFSDR